MAGKKRCFVSVRALKRLNESLLCEVLNKFPGYLQETRLKLPDPPDRDAMNYEAIQEACLSNDIPPDLDDVLFFVSILGTKRGQAQIEKEARYRHLRLDFPMDGLSCPDFAMKAWLHDWPRNRDPLEAAYARSRIFGKSSDQYNPMIRDLRSTLREPTPERLAEARGAAGGLLRQPRAAGARNQHPLLRSVARILFLVRYPGQIERHQAIDEDGNPSSHVFRPEEYRRAHLPHALRRSAAQHQPRTGPCLLPDHSRPLAFRPSQRVRPQARHHPAGSASGSLPRHLQLPGYRRVGGDPPGRDLFLPSGGG